MMITALLILVLSPLTAGGQQPPGPTTRHQFRTAGLPATSPMELVTFVNEYSPGAQTPPHTHPGLTVVTVLEGAVTVREPGAEQSYTVGDSFVEVPGVVVTALNSGPSRARLAASLVVPQAAVPSTPQAGAPAPPTAPTSLYPYRTEARIPAGPYEVAQAVLDFAPGAQTPLHTHPGQVVVTVLEGEQTIREQGAERVYRAGESFVEAPNVPVQAINRSAGRTTVLATYLLPQGAPLSTPAAAPAAGGGGLARRPLAPAGLALLGGGLLLTAGWGVCRRRARA